MISPEFGAAVPLFPLERLQESEFLQSAVDIAKLFADQQFDILEVSKNLSVARIFSYECNKASAA